MLHSRLRQNTIMWILLATADLGAVMLWRVLHVYLPTAGVNLPTLIAFVVCSGAAANLLWIDRSELRSELALEGQENNGWVTNTDAQQESVRLQDIEDERESQERVDGLWAREASRAAVDRMERGPEVAQRYQGRRYGKREAGSAETVPQAVELGLSQVLTPDARAAFVRRLDRYEQEKKSRWPVFNPEDFVKPQADDAAKRVSETDEGAGFPRGKIADFSSPQLARSNFLRALRDHGGPARPDRVSEADGAGSVASEAFEGTGMDFVADREPPAMQSMGFVAENPLLQAAISDLAVMPDGPARDVDFVMKLNIHDEITGVVPAQPAISAALSRLAAQIDEPQESTRASSPAGGSESSPDAGEDS
jgi:hypothetical protein